jgi:hypothetical protein
MKDLLPTLLGALHGLGVANAFRLYRKQSRVALLVKIESLAVATLY